MHATKDPQTVTKHGELIVPLIDGVKVTSLVTHPDARGTLTQLSGDLFAKPVVDAHGLEFHAPTTLGWWKKRVLADGIEAVLLHS